MLPGPPFIHWNVRDCCPHWSLVTTNSQNTTSNCPTVLIKETVSGFKWGHPWNRRLSGDLSCLNFVSCTAAPSFEIRQHFTFFSIHAGMHLAPPLLCNYGCVYTRWSCSCCSCHLSREAGAFDSLGSLFDLVLVAASMCSNYLTGSCFHMNYVASMWWCTGQLSPERHHTDGQQQRPSVHAL